MAGRPEDSIRSVLLLGLAATLGLTFALDVRRLDAATAPAPLVQSVRARSTVAYQGAQIVVNCEGTTNTAASLVQAEHAPPDWTQLDYLALGPSRRFTVIRRPGSEIRFDPQRRTGITTSGLNSEEDIFESAHLPWLLENYGITMVPDELLGRRATRIVLVPEIADRPSRTLVVDQRRDSVARPPEGSELVATSSGPIWVQRLGLRTLVHWSLAGKNVTVVGYATRTSLQAAAERTGVTAAPRLWDRLVTWLREVM